MEIHSNIFAEKFHGEGTMAGYSLWGHRESDMIE